MSDRQKIVPCLWFDNNAEEAVNHYLSIFEDGEILNCLRQTKEGSGQEGSVLTVEFTLQGQEFIALNGGPVFTFNEAISLYVKCDTQGEIDHYWDRLLEGGRPSQCGWLKDKFGVSWQIVPTALQTMMLDPDRDRAARVTAAMLKMVKLDIGILEKAYHSE